MFDGVHGSISPDTGLSLKVGSGGGGGDEKIFFLTFDARQGL